MAAATLVHSNPFRLTMHAAVRHSAHHRLYSSFNRSAHWMSKTGTGEKTEDAWRGCSAVTRRSAKSCGSCLRDAIQKLRGAPSCVSSQKLRFAWSESIWRPRRVEYSLGPGVTKRNRPAHGQITIPERRDSDRVLGQEFPLGLSTAPKSDWSEPLHATVEPAHVDSEASQASRGLMLSRLSRAADADVKFTGNPEL